MIYIVYIFYCVKVSINFKSCFTFKLIFFVFNDIVFFTYANKRELFRCLFLLPFRLWPTQNGTFITITTLIYEIFQIKLKNPKTLNFFQKCTFSLFFVGVFYSTKFMHLFKYSKYNLKFFFLHFDFFFKLLN